MNKSLTTAFIVLATSLAATAEQSWAQLWTSAYGAKDTKPSTANAAGYTAYYCTKAAAAAMFDEAETRQDIENYLKENYTDGLTALGEYKGNGSCELTEGAYVDGLSQYQFIARFADAITAGDYFALAFYESDMAFRVLASSDVESGNLTFDDSTLPAAAVGAWTKAVPEPTSGLLLLLGLAGLALKRKRA